MNIPAKFIAFDLETTGLENTKHQIIEIGAVKFTVELKNGVIFPKRLSAFSSFVRPDMLIPEEATRINGITNAMVENAPLLNDVLRKFTAFCGQDTFWVAHNAPFDVGFLRPAYAKSAQMIPSSPIFDSLRMARTLISQPSYKLGELAKYFKSTGQSTFELASDQLHRAEYDCEVLSHVFVALLRKRLKEKDFEMGNFLAAATKIQADPLYLHKK